MTYGEEQASVILSIHSIQEARLKQQSASILGEATMVSRETAYQTLNTAQFAMCTEGIFRSTVFSFCGIVITALVRAHNRRAS